jgi:hypothetical protein
VLSQKYIARLALASEKSFPEVETPESPVKNLFRGARSVLEGLFGTLAGEEVPTIDTGWPS